MLYDLKQFIAATVSQATAEDITGLKEDVASLKVHVANLEKKSTMGSLA